MGKKSLEDYMDSTRVTKYKEVKEQNKQAQVYGNNRELTSINLPHEESGGFIQKFKMRHFITEKVIQAARIKYDARIADLENMKDAYVIESETKWKTRSAVIVEAARLYFDEFESALKVEKESNLYKTIRELSEMVSQETQKIIDSDMNEIIKKMAIDKMFTSYEKRMLSIEKNELAKKYEIG